LVTVVLLSFLASLLVVSPLIVSHSFAGRLCKPVAEVVAPIGTPTSGFGYKDGDPYAEFLPPPVEVSADGDAEFMRAVVIVTEETRTGTPRSGQEYDNPLLVLSGREYASISFVDLHERICDALRGKAHG
jgi:hypothetical protein